MAGIRQFDEGVALDRALEVFWKKGYGPTSMQDLAAATGVQRGSLYNAYRDKESLFLQVFDRYKSRRLAEARAALDKPDIEDALRSYFDVTITSMTEGSPARGCLTTRTATDTTADADEIHAQLKSMVDGLQQELNIRLSTPEALSRLSLPPAEAARLLITLTRGIVIMESIYHDTASLRATVEAMIKVLLAK
ncbi:TetR/AcrR family transcriptional regulator [Undibacterium terreum]|uniref:TetR family transcriptional regulator n=1 Tax=Undibacterium terreum TaxID=1224302 RepID=A0A916XCX7_9BURK|nr:TetR/AcrR family transcriptional regulator [Undibacterium terreum]GGC64419.1 TetR family transcriptional regulator [Undibacterium terreum]